MSSPVSPAKPGEEPSSSATTLKLERRSIDVNDLPEDLKLPPGFVMASLEEQIRVAREDMHRWISNNQRRTAYERGHGSMHPVIYGAGLQARRSVIHTLLALQAGLSIPGAP